MIVALVAIAQNALQAKLDYHFERKIMELPPDIAIKLREQRASAKEKARQEAVEERRHQELCASIRATKPDSPAAGECCNHNCNQGRDCPNR